MNIDELLRDDCGPGTKCTWKNWKEHVFKPLGLTIVDPSGPEILDEAILTGEQAVVLVKAYKHTLTDPVAEWRKAYQILFKSPIESGTVLTTANGDPAKLTIQFSNGSQPFIFGKAYIPDTVGETLGRFLQSIKEPVRFGLKVILLPKSRGEVIARFGLGENEVGCKDCGQQLTLIS
jgi:hypothetical protein